MKKSLTLALCVASALMAQSASAEDHSTRAEIKTTSSHLAGQTMRVTKFLGATVRDQAGQSIGEIKDIVLQPTTGQAEFAVISLNNSDKLTAVPWRLLQPSSDPGKLMLSANRDKVMSATTFESSEWPAFDTAYNQRIYTHYGVTYDRSAVGGRVPLEGEYRAPVTTRENEKFPRPQPDGRETFQELNDREKSGDR